MKTSRELVEEYLAWEEMVSTGKDAHGERVEIVGTSVPKIREKMLADIGRAVVREAQTV